MIFGDTTELAIEPVFIGRSNNFLFGRLRFWLDGVCFGDFEDTSDLRASAYWGRTFLAASPKRSRVDLDAASADEVYELLYGRYIHPINTPRTKPYAGDWDSNPYVLDEVGESALRDDFAVVVVRRGDGADRILVKGFEDDSLREVVVADGVCDRILDAYCTWVEQLAP